jgi:hypothetical protein
VETALFRRDGLSQQRVFSIVGIKDCAPYHLIARIRAGGEIMDGRHRATNAAGKAGVVDLLFTGAVVVPLSLTAAGRLDIAMMALCPLLIGACMGAAYLEGPLSDPR